ERREPGPGEGREESAEGGADAERTAGRGLLPEGGPAAALGAAGEAFATTFLEGWIRRAKASGIKVVQQMARTLAAHRSGLLAYHDVLINSGPLEGTNHKIKTMKRQAYGFRDREFFKLKILAIHETKYALVG